MMAQKGYDVQGANVYNSEGPLDQQSLTRLICSYCQLLLREPKQVFSCGHRYCRLCLEQITSGRKGPFVCCVDHGEFSECHIRDDKACLNDIRGLSVDCPFLSNGCTWNGLLIDMEKHMEECLNSILLCSQGCGEKILKKDSDFHHSSHCPKRLSPCEFCSVRFPLDFMKNHHKMCQECPVNCDFCNKALPMRRGLKVHLRECTEYSMKCSYKNCQFEGKSNAMNQHISTSHLIQVLEDNLEMHEELRNIKSENLKLRSEISYLTSHVEKLVNSQEYNVKEIERLRTIVQQLEGEREKKASTDTDSVGTRPRKYHPSSSVKSSVPVTTCAETQPDWLEKEKCQTQLQNLTENIQAIQNSLAQYAIALDELRLRQDVPDMSSNNGLFTWKIPDICRRYRDAVDGKTVSVYSPPFYTSPHGYRLCIRIYLNGDGIGKGTHISVFFFIMRSEHDNLLSWPFKQSVLFTLINQKNPAASTTEAFVPDLHSPSFKKPDYDMNIASGFPKFAPQGILQDQNFTLNNTLVIHCHTNPNGLAFL